MDTFRDSIKLEINKDNLEKLKEELSGYRRYVYLDKKDLDSKDNNYTFLAPFLNGFARFKYFFINSNLELINVFPNIIVSDFHCNRARVINKDGFAYINGEGKIIFQGERFDYLSDYVQDYAIVYRRGGVNKNSYHLIVNLAGEVIGYYYRVRAMIGKNQAIVEDFRNRVKVIDLKTGKVVRKKTDFPVYRNIDKKLMKIRDNNMLIKLWQVDTGFCYAPFRNNKEEIKDGLPFKSLGENLALKYQFPIEGINKEEDIDWLVNYLVNMGNGYIDLNNLEIIYKERHDNLELMLK